eukprot:gene7092-16801_t
MAEVDFMQLLSDLSPEETSTVALGRTSVVPLRWKVMENRYQLRLD